MPLLSRFHRQTCLVLLLAALFGTLLLSPAQAQGDNAKAPPGIALPSGASVQRLAWTPAGSAVLLLQSGKSYSLWEARPGAAKLEAIQMPRSFSGLSGSAETGPDFCLSPAGNALAVLEAAAAPLKERRLHVFTLSGGQGQELSERLPAGFWPELLCFSDDGSELFMAARSFVNPEQEYSLGALQLESGKFMGVALKQNVDLLSALEYIPGRHALAIRAGGLNGEYPLEPVMLALELSSMKLYMLHSEAAQLRPRPQDDGSLLLHFDSALPRLSELGASREARADWLLARDAWELQQAQLSLPQAGASLGTSRDGAWIGFAARPAELKLSGAGKDEVLILQRLSDARTVVTEPACSIFAFSHDSRYVCSADNSEGRLYFFALPAS
ncbi:hypothetical protein IT575_08795 [bacterium]|nr:hypothetical protein [bacterium]